MKKATDPELIKALESKPPAGMKKVADASILQLLDAQTPNTSAAMNAVDPVTPDQPEAPPSALERQVEQTGQQMEGAGFFQKLLMGRQMTGQATGLPVAANPEVLPIAGATVATLGSRSPTLGAMAGNAIRGGLGGAAGGSVEAAITDKDVVPHALQRGAEEALGTLGGDAVNKTLGKVLAPLGPALSKEGRELVKRFRDEGLPPTLTLESLAPKSKLGTLVGKATESYLPMKVVTDLQRGRLARAFDKRLDDMVKQSGGEVRTLPDGKLDTGEFAEGIQSPIAQHVGQAIRRADSEAKAQMNRVLDSMPDGPQTMVTPTSTLRFLETLSKSTVNSVREYAQQKIDILRGGVPASEIENMFRQVNSELKGKFDPALKGTPQQAVKSHLLRDLQSAGGDATLFQKANEFFASNRQILRDSPVLRRIAHQGFNPSTLTLSLFRNGNEKAVEFVRDLMLKEDPKLWADLLSNELKRVIEMNTRKNGTLDGDRMLKFLQRNKNGYATAYGLDTMNALDNLSRLAQAGRIDLERMGFGNTGALSVATSIAGGAADITHMGAGTGTAAFIANELVRPGPASLKNFLLKDWTNSILAPAAQEGVRLGARAIAHDTDPAAQLQ